MSSCERCARDSAVTLMVKAGTPIQRCRRCGLVFSGWTPDRTALDAKYADYYSDANTNVHPVTRQRYGELLAAFARYRTTGRLLDVGCGFGFFLAAAREEGWDAHGTEISRAAPRYWEKMGIPADRAFLGDVTEARLPAASFDVITLFEVIEHVPDPARTLREVAALLRPGGLLYLTTPNFDALTRRLIGPAWSIVQPDEHLFYFTAATLGRLLGEAGFDVTNVRTTGLNYYEVLQHYRGKRAGGGGASPYTAMQQAREQIERRRALRTLKQTADATLSALGAGDTLKIFAERRPHRVLYLSYDGALDPLGRSQVLPYVTGMAGHGAEMSLLTFEKPDRLADDAHLSAVVRTLEAAGVSWHRAHYHKRPALLATAWDVAAGVARAVVAKRRAGATIVHARSYIAALIGLLTTRLTGGTLVFDMRGLWVDERADAGAWARESVIYRAGKRLERFLLRGAGAIVSLTHNGLAAVTDLPYMKGWTGATTVIPTCADLELFRPRLDAKRLAGLEGRFVVGYLGSLGTVYLFDEMLEFFRTVRRAHPEAVFSIVTNDVEWARTRLATAGLPDDALRIASHGRDGVAAAVAAFDISLLFYRPGWSRKATCPTKLAESLACGVPVVATAGIGDVAEVVRKHRVGAVLADTSAPAYADAWREIQDLRGEPAELRARCRAAAEEHFALDTGVQRYLELYGRLAGERA